LCAIWSKGALGAESVLIIFQHHLFFIQGNPFSQKQQHMFFLGHDPVTGLWSEPAKPLATGFIETCKIDGFLVENLIF
jgi:hypothetical protein